MNSSVDLYRFQKSKFNKEKAIFKFMLRITKIIDLSITFENCF
jgi:hypothetical protein